MVCMGLFSFAINEKQFRSWQLAADIAVIVSSLLFILWFVVICYIYMADYPFAQRTPVLLSMGTFWILCVIGIILVKTYIGLHYKFFQFKNTK